MPGPCDLPGPRRAGSSVLLGLAPDGVCPDAPRHRGAGAPLPHHFTFACARLTCGRAIGRIVSVALSRGFPRVGVTNRPCPVVSGLSSRSITPRDRMACCVKCRPSRPEPRRSGQLSSAPQASQPPAADIESPQTGQAAFPSATSSSQTPRIESSSVVPPGSNRADGAPDEEPRPLPAARRPILPGRERRHPQILLKTPTTRPRTRASRVRIGL